jgi:hypothetical protein
MNAQRMYRGHLRLVSGDCVISREDFEAECERIRQEEAARARAEVLLRTKWGVTLVLSFVAGYFFAHVWSVMPW